MKWMEVEDEDFKSELHKLDAGSNYKKSEQNISTVLCHTNYMRQHI